MERVRAIVLPIEAESVAQALLIVGLGENASAKRLRPVHRPVARREYDVKVRVAFSRLSSRLDP